MKRLKNYALTGSQLSLMTKIERFQGAFEATKFQRPALIDSLQRTTIITSSGSSTRIEGALLTDAQVEEFLDKGCKITKISSRSEREVAGYVKTLVYIYDNYDKIPITEKSIRELHSLLTSELLDDQLPKKQRGAYKDVTNNVVERNLVTGEEKIWFRTTPPGPETETAMADLVSTYREYLDKDVCHPLTLISGFIIHFLAIHPFRDGNGRLSRLITSLLLLKHGYRWSQYASHEKIIEDNKEDYYLSLRETQSSFNVAKPKYERWLNFILKVFAVQTEILQSKLVKESPISVMNENEKLIYQILESNGKSKISYLLEQSKLSRAGLKTLLKRLVDNGIIKKMGQGKGTQYYIG